MDPGRTNAEQLARRAAARLREHGYRAYLVGGCVRDLLLGRPPRDFDVATDARPEQILELEKSGNPSHDELMVLASSQRWVEAAMRGDPDDGAYAAGMGVGLIHEIPNCAELVSRIIADARAIIGQRLPAIAG